jgi:hypothetical protein
MSEEAKRDLAWGLYAGFVWNLGVAAVLNNPLQSSTRTWFVTLGAANELIGVLMIASPELLPLMAAVLGWIVNRTRAAALTLREIARKLFHRPHSVTVHGASSLDLAGSLETGFAKRTPSEDATTDELIAWLLIEYQRQDERIVALEKRQSEMPSEWKREIAKAKDAAQEHAQTLVRGLAGRHLSLRLLGLGFVVLGLPLSTVGNLV